MGFELSLCWSMACSVREVIPSDRAEIWHAARETISFVLEFEECDHG